MIFIHTSFVTELQLEVSDFTMALMTQMRDQNNAMSSTSGKKTNLVPNISYSSVGNVHRISCRNLAQNDQIEGITY